MKHQIAYAVAAVWIVAALIAWVTAVPNVISLSTFMWCNFVAAGLVFGLPAILRDGQPSRSMGGILYDAEHPDNRR